jgi:hypothetical protein
MVRKNRIVNEVITKEITVKVNRPLTGMEIIIMLTCVVGIAIIALPDMPECIRELKRFINIAR